MTLSTVFNKLKCIVNRTDYILYNIILGGHAGVLLIVCNQGARKEGRGNEPQPLRNVRCAEPPEDS